MLPDITRSLKKYVSVFQQAAEQDINEAETSLRIGKFLEEVLEYDVFQDITKEHTVKDKFVDYAIKLNGKVAFFIEVKPANVELREKHIEQASNYAANAGVNWVVLTNGRSWQLYRLSFDDGIASDMLMDVNLLTQDAKEVAGNLAYLHKKSLLKGELEEFYARARALSPKSIVQAIFHEDSLKMVRRNLRTMSGILVDEEGLVDGIKKMISSETWSIIGEVKIKRKRRPSKQRETTSTPSEQTGGTNSGGVTS